MDGCPVSSEVRASRLAEGLRKNRRGATTVKHSVMAKVWGWGGENW